MTDEDQPCDRTSENLTNQLENIKVAVRLRPFTEKEKQKNSKRIVDIEQKTVALYNPKGDTNLKKFTFDYSYWSHDGFKRDSNGINVPDSIHPNFQKYVGQEEVFEDLGQFLLTNTLKGYNSALLAYGQTGSGKSYTVSGYGRNEGILPRFARALFEELDKKTKANNASSSASESNNNEQASHEENNQESTESTHEQKKPENRINPNRYEVFFSMLEIYNEVVRDLLAKNHGDMITQTTFARRGLKVREHPKHGFFVENLTSYACADKVEIERRIEEGQLNKSIAATSMNETSSRGHTIYEFRIKQYKLKSTESPEETLTTSVVQLVDLAGSERLAVHVTGEMGGDSFIGGKTNSPFPINEKLKSVRNINRAIVPNPPSSASSVAQSSTSSVKQRSAQHNQSLYSDHQKRFKESVSINQSLSALGNCIQVLSQYSQQLESNFTAKKAPKIPYRDSVLTKLLNRCCLSGNSKVVIIATLSPAETNYDDTLSTLRFADRAKQIRTHATINKMSRNEVVDTLQKENERLKQMVDGRVTRSDDSSQTSNFDDSENVMENFTGFGIHSKTSNSDSTTTSVRGRTTIRKNRDDERHRSVRKSDKRNSTRLPNSSSIPDLSVKEQMKRLVSPASRKITKENISTNRNSRSMVHGLSGQRDLEENGSGGRDDDLGEVDLNEISNFEVTNEDDSGDIKEGIFSPDSDDSFAALAGEELSNEEKIGIFNKMLSISAVNNSTRQNDTSPSKDKMSRPKKANRIRGSTRQVSMLSSSLKKTNPYLSNLNPDEQLTGMISYIIKPGINIIGKSSDCDIVLHGTELRGHHARITRARANDAEEIADESKVDGSDMAFVAYIEPLFDKTDKTNEDGKSIALMVNGSPVTNNAREGRATGDTVADLDLVTFDMARNEVLRKVMAEEKNEAVIREINDYSHRPGTGKHKIRSEEIAERVTKDSAQVSKAKRLQHTRSMTIHDHDIISKDITNELRAKKPTIETSIKSEKIIDEGNKNEKEASLEQREARYRDQLMEDTYEYAIPTAEVNAVASEMDIKVTYELKILTGEEQILEQIGSSYTESTHSQGSSSMDDVIGSIDPQTQFDGQVTHLDKLDGLDVPPAVYIKVHLEDQNMDFYWSKEKFQARRFKILELYGSWDVNGKPGLVEHLIDQSKTEGDYLIDPFVDDPRSVPVLIGHAQITLQPISHLTDINQSYDILDLNDETIGTIIIQAIPCHPSGSEDENLQPFVPYSDNDIRENLLEDPNELLGKKLVFMLKIVSCRSIPNKYSCIHCQYSLSADRSTIRTKVLRDENLDNVISESDNEELVFNHTHFICFNSINQDIVHFLQHGFVTIQIIGHYKISDGRNWSPTVISTIINSINKYKSQRGNQNQYSGMNYTSGYSNSNSDSARSNQGPTSAIINSNSGASSVASTSATVNLFDQQNDDDEGINGLSQENIIDMILTKRKLDRAENQLHYLKQTVNIAEHYNKKHIPVKTVKKLLNSYGHELDSGSLEEMAADITVKGRNTNNKNSACSIQ